MTTVTAETATTMTIATSATSASSGTKSRPATEARVASGRREAGLRLTRRGRVVVLGGGLMVSLGLALGLAANSTATERPATVATITVGPGETLWQIAREVAVDGHTGDMVEQIKGLNRLTSGSLQVGQTLRVAVAS